jgi:acid phosphatase (class A)
LNFLEVLPPFPALKSPDDEADVDILRKWQQPAGSQRWLLAVADATQSYSQFDSAFGSAIGATSTPLLVHLLDRVEGDVGSSLVQAKQYFRRARPYQRLQLDNVCQRTQAPEDSYPSGHATYGWAVALVLAQVAPDRAQTVLARGREFGESRIVCANQYPSDVAGAQILATAALGRIGSKPEFKRDLSCAKQEHEVTLKTRDQIDTACKVLLAQAINR